ncbi:MAG: hypothetical protein SF339_19565 [Blastocatellia bacterium]|nr:hypothetical protein [Blastocatellia bacterium]
MAPPKRRPRKSEVGGIARWFLPSIASLSLWLVFYLLMTNAPRFLLDSDTGWHIRTGEMILAQRAVPRQDPFSYTMGGREWFAWEWLADVGMAGLHGWRGLAGLVAGSFLLLLASFALLSELMRRRGADPFIALAATLLGTIGTIVHWLARPHLLSILLMVLWCAMVEQYRRDRSRWIWWAPPLIALWANLHGAFVATFVVLGVYFIGDWLEMAVRGEAWTAATRRVLRTYLLVGLLSALASLATPYGVHLYGHLASYLTDTRLLATISEFQSPNFHSLDGKLIELLLLFGAIAAINALRQRRFVETGVLILWGHMTLQSERHVTMLVVMLLPFIAEQLTRLAGEAGDRVAAFNASGAKVFRAVRDWYRDTMAINAQLNGAFVYIALPLFIIWASGGSMANKILSPRFDARSHPVEAAEFILKQGPQGLPGNLFSSDQYGGYLIYRLFPEFKVFVDGRSDFYRQGTVLDDVDHLLRIKPQWAGVLDRYGIQWMVLKRDEPLSLLAQATGQWVIAHQDQTAQILMRKSNSPVTQAVNGAAKSVPGNPLQ